MVLTAVCAKINAPIFSIKHFETFQIAASLPIPQPSTLVGALAYCYGVERMIGLKAQEAIKGLIVAARAKLMSEATAINPIILRRFRVLDKGLEKSDFKRAYEAFHMSDFDTFRKIIENTLTDALYREYLTHATLKCIWVLRSPIDSKALYLIQRLGDTESLVNVIEAWSVDCKALSVNEISTDYPFAITSNVVDIRGGYTILKMCDENRESKLFYIPCKRDIRSTAGGIKYFVYTPTKVDIKLKNVQEVFAIDGEYIVRG
ncbi:MAG: type I-A CRISPR-associated protein Cas5a [Nitrososphaerota archaeon]|nr:type I-A CRISPR-associated protein Cas5a [Nitrososphaerales archaeon]MDW8045418.1 type I-A CRISPR-associated protein Cas5a [Nitrososphaerota archaeon]